MKRSIVLLVVFLIVPLAAMSHPASGIAVDSSGNVFFLDTGAGVWELELNGTLRKIPGHAFHWLTLDRTGRLAATELPSLPDGGASIERTEHNLLLASDFPMTTDSGGALYFPRKHDGRLRVFRLETNGSVSMFATIAERTPGIAPAWINGSVIGPDGSLYYTEDHGVWKVAPTKEAVAIPAPMPNSECGFVPGLGADEGARMYQGIDVDAKGNIFVAVTACRAVVKIAPNKSVTTVIRTTGTWSPTGVAVFGKDLYVLEYFHTIGHDRREWIPRIRKVAEDGSSSILVTVDRW